MFSDRDLHALLDYSSGNQVLSVYLNTDPTKTPTEAAKIKFRNLLKTVELKEDVQVVEEFLDLEYDWAAKGLAIFSDQSNEFFQTYSFNLSVPNKVYVGKKPTVPLSCDYSMLLQDGGLFWLINRARGYSPLILASLTKLMPFAVMMLNKPNVAGVMPCPDEWVARMPVQMSKILLIRTSKTWWN